MIYEWSLEPAQEKGGTDHADGDHLDVFGHEEEREFHAGILGMVTGSQFLFGFGHIKRSTVDFSHDGDEVDERANRLLNDEPHILLGVDDIQQAH